MDFRLRAFIQVLAQTHDEELYREVDTGDYDGYHDRHPNVWIAVLSLVQTISDCQRSSQTQ